jgi:hypothetical protein
MSHSQVQMAQEDLQNLMTIIYMAIQAYINKPGEMADVRKRLREYLFIRSSLLEKLVW